MTLYSLDDQAPEIDESAWVAPDAALMGKVRLAARASVWFGAVARGDNEWITIGEGTNIQELTMIHTDPGFAVTIGRDCTIGHKAIIHGCTIGDESLIGMGTTILNGAVIGKNCLVGAGALVTEGKTFEDGSLIIGAPARAVRQLDDAAIQGLRDSAARYAKNAQRFSTGLKAL